MFQSAHGVQPRPDQVTDMVYRPAKSESNPRWILAAILLLLPISAVFADSGQGAQPGRGYALNPHGILPGLTPDPNGLNPLSRGTRTPAGFLYGQPWQPPSLAPLSSTDWLYDLSFEVGYLATTGDTDSARFREYADMNEGTFVPGFALLAEEPGSGRYLEAYGGAVGRSDEYYQFDFGKAGYYRFSAFYNSIPHEFARGVPVLWNGVGSERLELPPELTPGGSTAVAVRDAFDAADNSRLSLERDEAGVSVRIMPLESLDLFASASSEERDGTRPFGGAFTFPFLGQVTESVEPIDYTTNEVSAGIHYMAELLQANLIYTGSWFRNDKDTLVWESPGLATSPGDFIPGEGRFALAPDNDYHNIRLDLAAPLPWWRGRYSVSAAYSNMRQDDDLRPPTISSATIAGATGPINLDLWNTVDALSRRKADAEIEARMLHGRLQLQPFRLLRLGAEMRLHYQHNKTDYTAFNPLTGDYGYIALDGGLGADIPSLSGVFEPDFPGSRVRYRSIPFDKDTSRLGLTADYRLGRKSSLGLSAEHEEAEERHAQPRHDATVDHRTPAAGDGVRGHGARRDDARHADPEPQGRRRTECNLALFEDEAPELEEEFEERVHAAGLSDSWRRRSCSCPSRTRRSSTGGDSTGSPPTPTRRRDRCSS